MEKPQCGLVASTLVADIQLVQLLGPLKCLVKEYFVEAVVLGRRIITHIDQSLLWALSPRKVQGKLTI